MYLSSSKNLGSTYPWFGLTLAKANLRRAESGEKPVTMNSLATQAGVAVVKALIKRTAVSALVVLLVLVAVVVWWIWKAIRQ